MRKTLIKLSLLLLLPIMGQAQQQIINTQYIFNRLLINPGYTGVEDKLVMSALVRNQWSGLDGAPNTQAFTVHSPIDQEKTASIGGIFVRDEIGVTVQMAAYFTASYRLQVAERSFLSVGLQGGFLNNQANYSELPGFANDPVFAGGDISEFRPNFGVGVYFYSDRFHAGLSAPNLFERDVDVANMDSNSNIDRFYYLDMGYQFYLSPDLTLDVNTLWKVLNGDPTQFDIYSMVGIRDKIWVGAAYRSFDSIDALFKVKIKDNFFLGYSYDFATTSELSRVNSGSHEFMLQFALNKK